MCVVNNHSDMVVVNLYCGIPSTVADGLGVFSMNPPGIIVLEKPMLKYCENAQIMTHLFVKTIHHSSEIHLVSFIVDMKTCTC